MNEVLQQLHDRKSVRVYRERAVEPEVKQAILEATIQAQPAAGEALLTCLQEADKTVKAALGRVFPGNDMEAIFSGVSLLAMGNNGQRVLVNFLGALEPVLRRGALDAARAQAEAL